MTCLLCDDCHVVAQLWGPCEPLSTHWCANAWAWSRPGGRRLPGQWVALSKLTKLSAIKRVIVCSLMCNRNLTYGEDTWLDCWDMIATIGDYEWPSSRWIGFKLCCLIGSLLLMSYPCNTGDVWAMEPDASWLTTSFISNELWSALSQTLSELLV
jgi:hypothetical protein